MHDQLNVTLPNSDKVAVSFGKTFAELIEHFPKNQQSDILAFKVDGKIIDLHTSIQQDVVVEPVFTDSQEGLEILRHDAAHILAEAVKELYPKVQITIGPVIDNGFYYDFATETNFSDNDLEKIEAKMHEIAAKNNQFKKKIASRADAIEFFKKQGEHYKAEIISDLAEDQEISLYSQGEFVDLCRGPHARSTGYIKYFKLLKVAGAYWRGDSNNQMLQRIYGTAWLTKEALDQYLYMLEESQKRDHRKIGKELELFHIQEEGQGMVFWHPKGWQLFLTLEQYIRNKLAKVGYQEVKTPILLDKSFWEASGHWEKFSENMFSLDADDKTFAIKPMSCPCHVQIFKQGIKSYRDLPIRMSEFGCCHRYEASGALHGLLRVRAFTQDDGHIFCTEDQVTQETIAFCKLLKEVYEDFGFTKIKIKFSDRPKVRAGSDETWTKAEDALKAASIASGIEYILNPGEGAFYGPKLEFVLQDAVGRDWQCGTFQVDLVLPERLDASYIDQNGKKCRPIMLHRAIFGTIERFTGILIEEYAGKFPLWLAPVQLSIITISEKFNEYANILYNKLKEKNIRAELDDSSERVGHKIKASVNKKIPLRIVIGKQEMETEIFPLSKLGSEEKQMITLEELVNYIYANSKL
ncbi:MAG: threonine--tRNA ligase [Rickettsiaceae bacterium]|nr:threonine--tRNA ligase [Rickettsiaceae bacterium]